MGFLLHAMTGNIFKAKDVLDHPEKALELLKEGTEKVTNAHQMWGLDLAHLVIARRDNPGRQTPHHATFISGEGAVDGLYVLAHVPKYGQQNLRPGQFSRHMPPYHCAIMQLRHYTTTPLRHYATPPHQVTAPSPHNSPAQPLHSLISTKAVRWTRRKCTAWCCSSMLSSTRLLRSPRLL
jgi:hypothetical protein